MIVALVVTLAPLAALAAPATTMPPPVNEPRRVL
jgi:hypothetical protein